MQETQEKQVRSLGWEDPLEKGKATQSSILAWRIPWSPWGHKELDMTERLSHFILMLPGLWVDCGGVYFRLWVWRDRLQARSQVQVDSKCVDPGAQVKGQWPCRGDTRVKN